MHQSKYAKVHGYIALLSPMKFNAAGTTRKIKVIDVSGAVKIKDLLKLRVCDC